MAQRLFLGILALIFLGYGLYCLVAPEALAGPAGIKALTITGTIELQAMYGGLQCGVGALCLVGSVKPEFARPALIALLFLLGGLATARSTLALMHMDMSAYTVFAALFELSSTAIALLLLRQGKVG